MYCVLIEYLIVLTALAFPYHHQWNQSVKSNRTTNPEVASMLSCWCYNRQVLVAFCRHAWAAPTAACRCSLRKPVGLSAEPRELQPVSLWSGPTAVLHMTWPDCKPLTSTPADSGRAWTRGRRLQTNRAQTGVDSNNKVFVLDYCTEVAYFTKASVLHLRCYFFGGISILQVVQSVGVSTGLFQSV